MLKMKMINIEAYIQPTNLTNVTQSNLICHSKLVSLSLSLSLSLGLIGEIVKKRTKKELD